MVAHVLMDVHEVSPGSSLSDNPSFSGPNEQPVERSHLAYGSEHKIDGPATIRGGFLI